MRYLSDAARVSAFALLALVLNSGALALNELPAKWRHGNLFPNTDDSQGFASCEAAGNHGLDEARALHGVAIQVISSSCVVDSLLTLRWDYRRVDDFPTTPNRSFQINPYCERGYFITLNSSAVGPFCAAGTAPEVRNIGLCETCVGNPIYPASGNKLQREVDYVGAGAFPLRFERIYNSLSRNVMAPRIGMTWWHTYHRSVSYGPKSSNILYVGVDRPDGRVLAFKKVGAAYVADPDAAERLQPDGNGWKLTNKDDEEERFDSNGRLTSITNRAGLSQTVSYFTSGANVGRIEKVTDSFQRTLTFEYNAAGRIGAVVDPAGGRYVYAYDANRNLTSVTYPDNKTRTYHYNESGLVAVSIPNALTGITDEKGVRFASFGYNTNGDASLSEHAGSAGKVTVSYSGGINVTTHISPTLSATRTYTRQIVHGVLLISAISGPACPSCGPPSRVYDSNGNVTSKSDWNGFRTAYSSYDLSRNLNLLRIEGLTSSSTNIPNISRTITTQWHPTYRLPTGIAEPLRITSFIYGDPADPSPGNRGSLLTKTIRATTNANGGAGFDATPTGSPRIWTYTYNANGSVLTVDGPRTDVADITTYTYYASNATCLGANAVGCRGQIESITNASGHVTQVTEYNVHGQPLTVVDPNGLTTTLAYDLRQRLTARTVGGEITTYTYDDAGQLTKVTLSDGSFLDYTYDNAHRLTQVADNLGNRITYTLDFAGNRTQEQVFDPGSQLAQTRSRVYNNLNRLTQEIGAMGQTTAFGYDNQGNVTSIDGPLAGTVDRTINTYDALSRLTRVTDPHSGQVNYGYNGLDQLTSVKDPRNLETTYGYDGLSNLNQQVSPDTGPTSNTYDLAGNLLTQTDAKGQVTSYAYDVLNRVTSITYHGGVVHTYAYDQGANGKGRLTQIVEPNSTTDYVYDQKGRLTSETRIIGGVSYVTAYAYDSAGRMTGITYPSGRQVNYTLDSLGRIQQVSTTKGGVTQPVVSSVAYRPFGPAQSFSLGNGQTYSRGFDQDGRIASYTLAIQSIAVGYDPASRISFLSDAGNPTNTNNYGYDNLDRLTSFTGPSLNQAFSYDGVGNRLTKTVGANTDTYTYGTTSNRLATIAGASNRTYAYDNNGSTTGDSVNTYAYDTRGRMVQATSSVGATDYKVNSLGQRIRKTNSQGDTVYHYDAQGKLIAESNAAGAVQKEYVYLGDTPVAVLQ
jgi:YD repeat-containing protein